MRVSPWVNLERVKVLAQGLSGGRLAVLGLEHPAFWSVTWSLNCWATDAHRLLSQSANVLFQMFSFIYLLCYLRCLLFCKVINNCEEESRERVCALQRAVAELELKLMKLQQRNERLEHRIEKLRLEKMNLRDTLKQVLRSTNKTSIHLLKNRTNLHACFSPFSLLFRK